MTTRYLAAGALLVAALAPVAAQHADAPTSLAPLKVIDVAFMNRKANACVDFNEFADGAWLATDTIPAAYSSSGVARDMSDRNELVVRSVLDDAMKKRGTLPATSTERKLGTYYATCMDSAGAERAGLSPIKPQLDAIDAMTTKADVLRQIAAAHVRGIDAGFAYGPDVDPHDALHYLGGFGAGGLGLPDRDYYTKTDPSSDSLRTFYANHITTLLSMAGEAQANARADAQKIIAFETELAKATLTRVARRDPSAIDHPMTLAQFHTLTPNIDWAAYFRDVGLSAPANKLNVAEPEFYKRLNALIASTPMDTWKAYLRYHTVADASAWLGTPFVNENFRFSSKFSGAKELLPRWKRCLRNADASIGEALGQAYIAKTFSPQARARAKSVIDDIRASFGQRVQALDWMSPATKKQALDKLTKMGEKVGYPNVWRNYSTLQVAEGPFVLNAQHAAEFEWKRTVNRPGTAVDTTEWGMTVPTVNAYYDPTKNEMVFPAGALAPQTFDPKADDAANYGSLGGSWAGHELTHGFDDEGRHYDAKGNLRDWWAPSDSVRFTREAQKVVDQFNRYIQVDTFHVNGKLTLGENIADYGGLLTSYDALQRALKRNGRPGPIDGFTPEQRFFIAYAQSWRSHSRPEQMKTRVTVDPHAPEKWRSNGPLSNMPQFAAAFGCKPGDPMVRPAALIPHIW
ncbi:MAG TPA: M13 family metallopeptidase [Gemmatimonadaceae bacterium]|nr:M13 family metallopeptidase [Gemmatimonadaceae bacterium]